VPFSPLSISIEPARLAAHLASGDSAIEHWLGHHDFDGFRSIRWLRIAKEGASWAVYEKEVLDIGGVSFCDMDEFPAVGDPDAPEGVRTAFSTPEEAIQHAIGCGATPEGFIARGGLQVRYLDSVARLPRPEKGIDQWLIVG
jgi:hypothetical protein